MKYNWKKFAVLLENQVYLKFVSFEGLFRQGTVHCTCKNLMSFLTIDSAEKIQIQLNL